MTQPQTPAHHFATEVEIAVLQTYFFAHSLVQLERQWLGAVQQFKLLRQKFDPSGGEVGVNRASWTLAHIPFHLDDVIAAEALGLLEHGRRIGIEDDLQQTLAVAKINKNDPTMVPAPVYPARHGDFQADQLVVDLSAVM